LFGVPTMTRGGTPVRAWRAQLARELLFYFALHADRTVRTEALLDELLPETDFDRALTALRYAVHQVRRLFAPLAPLQTEKNSYRFALETPIWCDAIEFQRLLAEATRLERPDRYAPRGGGAGAPAEAAQAREAAVALYTGPLLDGFDAEWVLPLRAQMERQFLSAASALLDYYARGKRHADAVHLAQHVLRLDPLQEEFHLAILRHQVAAGHLAAARQHFEYYRRLMRDELGQEPAEEALRLAEALQIGARSVGA
jgi:DNA-binding SARP family transcriptional activator